MTYEKNPREGDPEIAAGGGEAPTSGISRFASLTAGLLARKGEAKPALEPFANARMAPGSAREMGRGERHMLDRRVNGETVAQASRTKDAAPLKPAPHWELPHANELQDAHRLADFDAPRPIARPAARHHDDHQAAHACEDGAAGEANCPRRSFSRRAAVAVRMSTQDYLRLRLAAAELEISAHDIVIAALDAYLDEKGVERFDECLCLQKASRLCDDEGAPQGEDQG
jgi:hypothetical protein